MYMSKRHQEVEESFLKLSGKNRTPQVYVALCKAAKIRESAIKNRLSAIKLFRVEAAPVQATPAPAPAPAPVKKPARPGGKEKKKRSWEEEFEEALNVGTDTGTKAEEAEEEEDEEDEEEDES